jgi:23S rRNA (uracil1939-C5)-methyltransferase
LNTVFSPGREKSDIIGPLAVSDLSVNGTGIARHEGRVVFLDGGLPGAIVTAAIRSAAKNILYASVVETLAASPHSAAPFCPHAGKCGACALQHFAYEAALAWKREHVRSVLTRIGRTENPDVAELLPSPKRRAWRSKMAYAFAPAYGAGSAGGLALGLRVGGSKTVVPVTACAAQDTVVMRLSAYVRARAHNLGLPAWEGGEGIRRKTARKPYGTKHARSAGSRGYLRSLVVHTPEYAPAGRRQLLVEIISGPEHTVRGERGPADAGCDPHGNGHETGLSRSEKVRILGKELTERFGLTGFIHSERARLSDVAEGERKVYATGSEHRLEQYGNITVKAPYDAFLQTNTLCARALFALAAEAAGPAGTQTVWDLYSGVGCIALCLAGAARAVHGVELSAGAVAAARENAVAAGFEQCFFHQGSPCPERMRGLPIPQLIVVDPPRAGLSADVIELLLEVPAERLLYLSCDAPRQARDVALLSPVWRAVKSFPADMFPYTPHVENLLIMERRMI